MFVRNRAVLPLDKKRADVFLCRDRRLSNGPISMKRILSGFSEKHRLDTSEVWPALVNMSRRKAWKVKRENRLDCLPRQSVNVLSAIYKDVA